MLLHTNEENIMFTNFIAYLFNTVIGNDEMALRHEFIMKATWAFKRQEAITDLLVGSLSCAVAVGVVYFIATKIDTFYKGAKNV